MMVESYIDVIKGIKKKGIGIKYKNTSGNKEINLDIYEELKKLYQEYVTQLNSDTSKLDAKTQLTIDLRLSTALYIALEGKKEEEDGKAYLNAIKTFLLEEMQNENYYILDSIIFESNRYLNAIFNDSESVRIVKDYLTKCNLKVEALVNKYNEDKISPEEKSILIKLLSTGIFDKKYEATKKKIFREILSKNDLNKIENEYIIRETAKWKCKRKKIKYKRPYLMELDEENKEPEYMGVHFQGTGIVYVCHTKTKDKGRTSTFTLLHEYEHYIQDLDCQNGILTENSVAELFFQILFEYSNQTYNEYDDNYSFKSIEVMANSRAVEEMLLLTIDKMGMPARRTPKPSKEGSSKREIGETFRTAMVAGHQREETKTEHTVIEYSIGFVEKALQNNEKLIDEYPLIKSFYNQNEKRLKTIQELSEEYTNQPIEGRDALTTFVDYQVLHGGLDDINLDEMSIEEKVNILLMISREFKNVLSRLYIFLNGVDSDNLGYKEREDLVRNFAEIVKLIKKITTFLRTNMETINELSDIWTNYVSDQTVGCELLETVNSPKKIFLLSSDANLGLGINDPFFILQRFGSENIVDIITNSNETLKTISPEKRAKAELYLKKLEEQLYEEQTTEVKK